MIGVSSTLIFFYGNFENKIKKNSTVSESEELIITFSEVELPLALLIRIFHNKEPGWSFHSFLGSFQRRNNPRVLIAPGKDF